MKNNKILDKFCSDDLDKNILLNIYFQFMSGIHFEIDLVKIYF